MSEPTDPTRRVTDVVETAPPVHVDAIELPRFTLDLLGGAEALAGGARRWESNGPLCAIGSHPSNDLVIDHPGVSRFHCRVEVSKEGARILDRDSTNGTVVDGVRVQDAWLKAGSRIALGAVQLRFGWAASRVRVPLSERARMGPLVGRSVAMRELFGVLERCAKSDATVLVTGETGTGKEGVAEAIHEESARAD